MRARRIRETASDRAFLLVVYSILGVVVVSILYPLYYTLIASVSDPIAVYQGEVVLRPAGFTLEGYDRLLRDAAIPRGYWNTVVITALGTALSVFLTLTAAFALAQRQLRGQALVTGFFAFTMFFNGGMIPTYLLVRGLGLLNTYWALILPGAVGAWNVFLVRTFYRTSIPEELYEAAVLEGASVTCYYYRIALPLSKAIVSVMALPFPYIKLLRRKLMMRKTCVVIFALSLSVLSGTMAFASGRKEAPASDVGFQSTGLPIVTKPFTFSAVTSKDVKHGPYAEMGVFKRMAKETGVIVDWIEIPETNYTEKKNLLFASNDLPDVVMSALSDGDIVRYSSQGVIIPLEGLIDTYAPRIKAILRKRPDIKKYLTAPDGHIYTLPRIQELAHRVDPDNMFINKTWLDKLGLAVPTTPEEFYQVLVAFHEKDPNGNGKKDEIPFGFGIVGKVRANMPNSFFGAFGQLDDPDRHLMVDKGKVYFTASAEGYRKGLAYLAKLYKEGLIDPEAFTQDRKQYNAKGRTPDELYGVFFEWFDENMVGDERAKKDYIALPPLIGPDGNRRWNWAPDQLLSRANFAITNKMWHPEVAIRWADQCYDWATSFELCYGTWG